MEPNLRSVHLFFICHSSVDKLNTHMHKTLAKRSPRGPSRTYMGGSIEGSTEHQQWAVALPPPSPKEKHGSDSQAVLQAGPATELTSRGPWLPVFPAPRCCCALWLNSFSPGKHFHSRHPKCASPKCGWTNQLSRWNGPLKHKVTQGRSLT